MGCSRQNAGGFAPGPPRPLHPRERTTRSLCKLSFSFSLSPLHPTSGSGFCPAVAVEATGGLQISCVSRTDLLHHVCLTPVNAEAGGKLPHTDRKLGVDCRPLM